MPLIVDPPKPYVFEIEDFDQARTITLKGRLSWSRFSISYQKNTNADKEENSPLNFSFNPIHDDNIVAIKVVISEGKEIHHFVCALNVDNVTIKITNRSTNCELEVNDAVFTIPLNAPLSGIKTLSVEGGIKISGILFDKANPPPPYQLEDPLKHKRFVPNETRQSEEKHDDWPFSKDSGFKPPTPNQRPNSANGHPGNDQFSTSRPASSGTTPKQNSNVKFDANESNQNKGKHDNWPFPKDSRFERPTSNQHSSPRCSDLDQLFANPSPYGRTTPNRNYNLYTQDNDPGISTPVAIGAGVAAVAAIGGILYGVSKLFKKDDDKN